MTQRRLPTLRPPRKRRKERLHGQRATHVLLVETTSHHQQVSRIPAADTATTRSPQRDIADLAAHAASGLGAEPAAPPQPAPRHASRRRNVPQSGQQNQLTSRADDPLGLSQLIASGVIDVVSVGRDPAIAGNVLRYRRSDVEGWLDEHTDERR